MRTRWGIVLCLLALLVPLSGQQALAGSCPAPKSCRAYALYSYRWPAKPGQPIVIPYYVSTRISSLTYPAAGLPGVVRAATSVWERANPRIQFRYLGTTDVLPGAVADGKNVIGFSAPQGLPGLELADAPATTTQAGVVLEMDLDIDPARPWVWDSCPQRDRGCAGHSTEIAPGTWGPELQGVIEHELGHWLSLDHADNSDADGSEMTMFSTTPGVDNLKQQTLGLGDILGVRAAYPCGRCNGPPVVYAP